MPLDYKIDEWIPRINGGFRVDKGHRDWHDFQKLRYIRDEYQSHPKPDIYGVSDSQFCQQLNLFRTGIALLLLRLHAMTGRGVPPDIVRYAYLPDIEIMRET